MDNKKQSAAVASKKYYETNKEKILLKRRQKYTPVVKKEKVIDNDLLIKEAVYYNDNEGRYKRVDNIIKNPITKSMRVEFVWVLETLTKTEFVPEDWGKSEQEFDYGNVTNGSFCACTNSITKDYTIVHKPTQIHVEVGCDCV